MTQIILSFFIAVISANCFAAAEASSVEIVFKGKSLSHRYTLLKDTKKSSFKLTFQNKKEKPITKTISISQADSFKADATRIIWNSLYRKPANTRNCTNYATVQAGSEKANICVENRKATALTYGLLNSLNRVFQ